jgi:hypothetical protein
MPPVFSTFLRLVVPSGHGMTVSHLPSKSRIEAAIVIEF